MQATINFQRRRNTKVTNQLSHSGAYVSTTIDLSEYPVMGESLPVEISHTITGGTDVTYNATLGVLCLFDSLEIKCGDTTTPSRIPVARLVEMVGDYEQNSRARLVSSILTGKNTGTKVLAQQGIPANDENDWSRYVRHVLRNSLTDGLASRIEVDQKTWVVDLFELVPFFRTMLANYGYVTNLPELSVTLYWATNINSRLNYATAPTAHSFSIHNYVYVPVPGFDVSKLEIPREMVWLEPTYDRLNIAKASVNTGYTDDIYLDDEGLQGLYVDRVYLGFKPTTDTSEDTNDLGEFSSISLFEAEHRVEVNNNSISGKTLRSVSDIENNALRQRPIIGKLAQNPVTRFQALYSQNLNRLDAHYSLPYPHSYRELDPITLNWQVGRKSYVQHVIGDQIFNIRYTVRYRPRGTEDEDQWDSYQVNRLAYVGRKIVIDENLVDVGYANALDMAKY